MLNVAMAEIGLHFRFRLCKAWAHMLVRIGRQHEIAYASDKSNTRCFLLCDRHGIIAAAAIDHDTLITEQKFEYYSQPRCG